VAIYLKRNNKRDPWFRVHTEYVKPGEIVKLAELQESKGSPTHPSTIRVYRSKQVDKSRYLYTASLCCYDYVGSTGGTNA